MKNYREFVIDTVREPLEAAAYLADKFAAKEDADRSFKQRLPRWEKAFAKLNPTLTPASINHIQEKFSFWRHALGFAPDKTQPRLKLLKNIAVALTGLLGLIGAIKTETGAQIIAWLQSLLK